jgi:hypothetical protein
MKICTYCGRENEDAAIACIECGTETLRPPGPPPLPNAPIFTLATLQSDPGTLFRALVLVSLATYALGYLGAPWFDRFLSSEVRTLLEWDGYGELIAIPRRILQLESILFMISLLGMFWFLRSARLLYFWIVAAFCVQYLIGGTRVYNPITSAFGYIGSLADGAILFLAWFSPLKNRFHEPLPERLRVGDEPQIND